MEFIQTIGKLVVRYHSFFEEGIVNTLIIAAFTVFFGTIFGTLMSSMRMSKILPLKWLAVAYIEFIRGTPLMVQLMFIFYGLPMVGFTLPDISWIPNFSRFSAGIIAMSINSCAYVAEIIRSGVQAVDVGQMEAARSVVRLCASSCCRRRSRTFSPRLATSSSRSSRSRPSFRSSVLPT